MNLPTNSLKILGKMVFKLAYPKTNLVSKVIANHNRDPSYAYRDSKNVCQIIRSLFLNLYERQNLSELKKLTKAIHISNFGSWKNLNEISTDICYVINNEFQPLNSAQPLKNFISLCEILSSMNYQISQNDANFIQLNAMKIIKTEDFKLATEQSLKSIYAISRHFQIFRRFEGQKNILQNRILQKIDQSQKIERKYVDISPSHQASSKIYDQTTHQISNLVKNGLYQSFWDEKFLQSLVQLIKSKQILQVQYKSALKAVQLGNKHHCDNKIDQWVQSKNIIPSSRTKSNFNLVTEDKIFNILKQLDYEVQAHMALLNYEVDYKLGEQFVVQFHGIHHYRINQKVPLQTSKSEWKVKSFRKRGYKVVIIPFYLWNRLETIYQKKAWLIGHIQKQLLS